MCLRRFTSNLCSIPVYRFFLASAKSARFDGLWRLCQFSVGGHAKF